MITKEKFDAFVEVQKSGAINMMIVKSVIELADEDLTKEEVLDIMKNYDTYEKQFAN